MGQNWKRAAACGLVALACTACRKTADNSINYKNAIDAYYAVHPTCIWPEPKRFPAQADTSNRDQTAQYDTLYDDGLLTRTTDEKKVLIFASKQVTNYDLSDKGRSAWTPDPSQPGSGNFCYGHRTVQSIDSATPNDGNPGATSQVSYLYSFGGVPDWARNPETQGTFPRVQTQILGHGGATATLVDTPNGWQMKAPPTHGTDAATDPDANIVQ